MALWQMVWRYSHFSYGESFDISAYKFSHQSGRLIVSRVFFTHFISGTNQTAFDLVLNFARLFLRIRLRRFEKQFLGIGRIDYNGYTPRVQIVGKLGE